MTDHSSQPWWIAAAAAIPGLVLAFWKSKTETGEKRDEREVRELDASRSRLAEREASLQKRQDAETDRRASEIEELIRDRDNGWFLGRYWYDANWKMLHRLRNAIASRDALLRQHGLPVPDDAAPDIGPMEAPLANMPRNK